MADYYARRAKAGLIISEATNIRPDAQGYINTPGIFTTEQIKGWQKVTQAVHNNGGLIFCQLWHTGRVAHSYFSGHQPIAPSAVGLEGQVPRKRELNYEVPKAATPQDIEQLIKDYAQSAINSIEAGFDGVEIHGANGYLIDQFLHYDSNRRDDQYGQTPENMARFPLAVVDAICQAIGKDRTAIRLSPAAYFNIKTFVGVGGYTAQTASKAIANDKFDLIAIGRAFIANPNYVELVEAQQAVKEYNDEMLKTLY